MKFEFIINPKAGSGLIKKDLEDAVSKANLFDKSSFYISSSLKDIKNHIDNYPDTKEDICFVACGGDGTLSEVFNACVDKDNYYVACFPCGSGNDFVKYFGGKDKFLNLNYLNNYDVINIDLMKVDNRYSNNVINFGFDTTVAITVNDARNKRGKAGKHLYTLGIIKAIIHSMNNNFKVYADDELLNPDGKALLCTLGNGQYVGGSFKCSPNARLDDGLIEVCLIKPMSRFKLVSLIKYYEMGEHIDNEELKEYVVYRQAKKIEVIAENGFAYSLDGEIIYNNHFIVDICSNKVKFIYPKIK